DTTLGVITVQYPVYIQITYMRKNMQVKMLHVSYAETIESIDERVLELERRTILQTIRLLQQKQGDRFTLKGLGKYYEVFGQDFARYLDRYMKDKLGMIASKCEPFHFYLAMDFSTVRASFNTLYEMCRKLFDHFEDKLTEEFKTELRYFKEYTRFDRPKHFFDFYTVIDWMDGRAYEDYQQYLGKTYGYGREEFKARLKFFLHIIKKQTGNSA
ncbi:hypothetical protein, partial [Fulvivirga kasyanovii]